MCQRDPKGMGAAWRMLCPGGSLRGQRLCLEDVMCHGPPESVGARGFPGGWVLWVWDAACQGVSGGVGASCQGFPEGAGAVSGEGVSPQRWGGATCRGTAGGRSRVGGGGGVPGGGRCRAGGGRGVGPDGSAAPPPPPPPPPPPAEAPAVGAAAGLRSRHPAPAAPMGRPTARPARRGS